MVDEAAVEVDAIAFEAGYGALFLGCLNGASWKVMAWGGTPLHLSRRIFGL